MSDDRSYHLEGGEKMKVEIKAIIKPGVLENERLVLRVLQNCDIGYYVALDSTYRQDGNISNLVRHPYWFPDRQVATGDRVILYTKVGKRSSKTNKDGSVSHFFYRDMERTIWNKETDCAVVFELNTWTSKGY
jgi:hypothetical protein